MAGGPCRAGGVCEMAVLVEKGGCDVCVGVCSMPQGRYADARQRGFWTVRLDDGVVCCDGDVRAPLAGWVAVCPGEETGLVYDAATCTLEVAVHGRRWAVATGPVPSGAHLVVCTMRGNTVRVLRASHSAPPATAKL